MSPSIQKYIEDSEKEFYEQKGSFQIGDGGMYTTYDDERLKSFLTSQLKGLVEVIKGEIEGHKRQDACLEPFNITAEYRLGELRGQNYILDKFLSLLSETEDSNK